MQLHYFAACVAALLAASPGGFAADSSQKIGPSGTPAGDPVVVGIDGRLETAWGAQGVTPLKMADDAVWCRRLFLDLLGRIPTTSELATFSAAPARDRRPRLAQRLLFDEGYTVERVDYWTEVWLHWLIGRDADDNGDSLADRNGLRHYLRDSLRENKPYHQMVQELVAAEGTSTSVSPKFNGAVNYLLKKINDGKTEEATAHIARFFLGRQIECTQCHNHPFNEWKQNQFWELDSFLRQTVALRRFDPGNGGQRHSFVELTDQDFPGEGNHPDQAEIYYEQRNGELRVAYPRFFDAAPVNPSGYLSVCHRRQQLAKFVGESELLAPALVNRMWSHFLGYGFTKPIDDMGPHNPPSHPELLDELSEQWGRGGYDLRRLMQWIVLSRPYQLSSETDPAWHGDDPQAQPEAAFSRFYVRPMSAEQLYMSLWIVAQPTGTGSRHGPGEDAATGTGMDREARDTWTQRFLRDADADEGTDRTTFRGTIPQALMLFHGDLTQRALEARPGTYLGGVIDSRDYLTTKIHQLYMAALSRRPSSPEVAAVRKRIEASGDVAAGLGDLWWALLNSNEFAMVH